jgi:hypothetical protein
MKIKEIFEEKKNIYLYISRSTIYIAFLSLFFLYTFLLPLVHFEIICYYRRRKKKEFNNVARNTYFLIIIFLRRYRNIFLFFIKHFMLLIMLDMCLYVGQ